MRGTISPAVGRRYPLTMICQVWRVPRSSVYADVDGARLEGRAPRAKRGPVSLSTSAIVMRIG